MKRIKKIIQDNRGEMLLESVLSILMFSIIMLGIVTIISVASNINKNAEKMDKEYYIQLGEVMKDLPISQEPEKMNYKLTYSIEMKKSDGSSIIANPLNTQISKELSITDKGIITLK